MSYSVIEKTAVDTVFSSCLSSVVTTSTGIKFRAVPSVECSTFCGMGDGPREPKSFSWNERELELEWIPWRLLIAMWNKDTLSVTEIYKFVWGGFGEDGSIRTALVKINHVFDQLGYPRRLRKSVTTIFWSPRAVEKH